MTYLSSVFRVSGWFMAMISVLTFLVSGCERQPPEAPPEMSRAVKTITVSDVAHGQIRRFAGIVEAGASSQLSFQVSGEVVEIHANVGDRVKEDELLAKLEREPYVLKYESAKADLEKARIELGNSQDDLRRKSRLAKTGHVSQAMLNQAQARYDAAKKSVELAQTQMQLALRDLQHTELKAPFAGAVVKRWIEPFMKVQPGQAVFELEGDNELEVELLIPETLIGWIKLGQLVAIEFPAMGRQGQNVTGRVSRIGVRADEANAYPVTVTLLDPDAGIRSGMTAEVTFTFQRGGNIEAYLIPMNAILPPKNGPQQLSEQHKEASLFVFDKTTSTVVRRPIEIGYFSGNQAGIVAGVEAGEIVVVAGVHHLYDGQKVTLLQQP